MDTKPFVTHHGDQELFTAIQVELVQTLPRERMDWRRSYGRASKMIEVNVNFVPFNSDLLPREDDPQHLKMLLRLPLFHIFFTDCPDTDAYRIVVKDKIALWLQTLKDRGISDWLIVLVEPSNPRRGTKPKLLPKLSVVDRIKNDFCGRQADRIIVLHEPNNPVPNNKSMESWAAFVNRLRYLFVVAYNRTFNRFEEVVRSEREKRTEKGWDFCSYFLLQEELALALESLNIYEDALVQYDELDALFSQFIINSQAGDIPAWLSTFASTCSCWDGINLTDAFNKDIREIIIDGKPSLVDLRNYLFSRQCALLFKLQRPWEVAQRAQSFMHTCVQELGILEVPMPTGSVACWVFLTCLEVLQKYEKVTDMFQMETHSHHTANLWVYAQKKLDELGELCGLMPDTHPTSEQLNAVVDLMSGMGRSSQVTHRENSPNQKLREALSSTDAFQKHFLELSELAMGTFKHIGRLRSASLMGKQLARFYQRKRDFQKAEVFWEDALRRYVQEGWKLLTLDTRLQVVECQRELPEKDKYIHTCCNLAGDPLLDMEKRLYFFKEMQMVAEQIRAQQEKDDEPSNDETGILIPFQSVFGLADISILNEEEVCSKNTEVKVKAVLISRLPQPVTFKEISVGFLNEDCRDPGSPTSSRGSIRSFARNSLRRQKSQESADFFVLLDLSQHSVKDSCPDIQGEVRTLEDGRKVASVHCRNAITFLKRQDSSTSWGKSKRGLHKEDCSTSVEVNDVSLVPGENELHFSLRFDENGFFIAKHLSIQLLEGVEFFLPLEDLGAVGVEIYSPDPHLTVQLPGKLLTGIPQEISLIVSTGHHVLEKGQIISLTPSKELTIFPLKMPEYTVECTDNGSEIHILEALDCNVEKMFTVEVMMSGRIEVEDAETDGYDQDKHEQELEVSCPWQETVTTLMSFRNPFTIGHKCHTFGKRKVLHVSVNNPTEVDFELCEAKLIISGADPKDVQDVNQTEQHILPANETLGLVWFIPSRADEYPRSCRFSFSFCLSYEELTRSRCNVQYTFNIDDIQTKYIVSSYIVPTDERERCSMGSLCKLYITIQSAMDKDTELMNECNSLLYEVQTIGMWTICGRNKGIVDAPSGSEVTTMELEMLPSMAGYLPLPGIKLSEYRGGSSSDTETDDILTLESSLSVETQTEPGDEMDAPPHVNAAPVITPLSSNHVYYKSKATQLNVFPECNNSTVEVSIS